MGAIFWVSIITRNHPASLVGNTDDFGRDMILAF